MKAKQATEGPKPRSLIISVSIVILLFVGIVWYDSRDWEYTIIVQHQEWTVKNSIAHRVLKNGSMHSAEGVTAYRTNFPYASINRTIEIDLEITDGTIDLLVFDGIKDYHSWLYGYYYFTELALYHWENTTSIEITFRFENSSVYIAQRAHQGGAWVVGPILAWCYLS